MKSRLQSHLPDRVFQGLRRGHPANAPPEPALLVEGYKGAAGLGQRRHPLGIYRGAVFQGRGYGFPGFPQEDLFFRLGKGKIHRISIAGNPQNCNLHRRGVKNQ